MTTEEIVRDQLDRATQHVLGGPGLEAAIEQGRRNRRRRRGALGLAAVAVVGLGAVGLRVATADDDPTTVQDAPVADAPAAAGDFVPGTDIDEKLAAVVAHQLPNLPAPDDVYPSDSHTAGPIADADWASAEDWQASYTFGGGDTFAVITGLPSEGFSCQGCEQESVPGGTVYHQTSQNLDDGSWQFGTWLGRPDGSYVGAFEYAPGAVGGREPDDRVLSDAALEALVQDPGLTFAALGASAP